MLLYHGRIVTIAVQLEILPVPCHRDGRYVQGPKGCGGQGTRVLASVNLSFLEKALYRHGEYGAEITPIIPDIIGIRWVAAEGAHVHERVADPFSCLLRGRCSSLHHYLVH